MKKYLVLAVVFMAVAATVVARPKERHGDSLPAEFNLVTYLYLINN
ncbi:MAG: hypothetical protein K2O10_03920 [Muribaculaceae bacterium]|nr:hypothetical protein [Muribaculaceae bacterium]